MAGSFTQCGFSVPVSGHEALGMTPWGVCCPFAVSFLGDPYPRPVVQRVLGLATVARWERLSATRRANRLSRLNRYRGTPDPRQGDRQLGEPLGHRGDEELYPHAYQDALVLPVLDRDSGEARSLAEVPSKRPDGSAAHAGEALPLAPLEGHGAEGMRGRLPHRLLVRRSMHALVGDVHAPAQQIGVELLEEPALRQPADDRHRQGRGDGPGELERHVQGPDGLLWCEDPAVPLNRRSTRRSSASSPPAASSRRRQGAAPRAARGRQDTSGGGGVAPRRWPSTSRHGARRCGRRKRRSSGCQGVFGYGPVNHLA